MFTKLIIIIFNCPPDCKTFNEPYWIIQYNEQIISLTDSLNENIMDSVNQNYN